MKADGESVESMAMPRLGGLAARVALALALVAALAAISVAEDAEAFTVDGIDYEVTDEGSHQVKITSYSGSPEHVYGTVSFGEAEWTVVSVEENAFNNCVSLQTVDLGSATTVEDYAFNNCYSLQTVDLGSATSVGDHAFYGCSSLQTVDLGSATSVGDEAFHHCDALEYTRFSDALESVGFEAFTVSFFSVGTKLTKDADSLKGRAFTGDGDGGLYEGFWAPSQDGGGDILCKIIKNSVVREVEVVGFSGAPVQVSGMVTHKGYDWTVVSLHEHAFIACGSLEIVNASKIEKIGEYAFSGCPSLREVLIPSSVQSIGDGAFEGLVFKGPSGEELPQDAVSLRGHLYLGDGDGTLGRSERDGTCGEGLYWSLDADGVLTIAGEGYMESYDGGRCPWGVGVTKVVAGGGVRSIGDSAFNGCTSLASASMPAAESIGDSAFNYCKSLVSVEMPAAASIGIGAFSSCESLESASMPAATSIGDGAFEVCGSLREVLIPASVESVGEDAFGDLSFLGQDGEELDQDAEALRGHLYLGEGDGRLYRADGEGTCGEGLSWVVGFDRVLRIDGEGYMDDYAEAGRGPWGTYVKEVVAGEGVRSVGILAFRGCESLVTASLPGVESIGDAAFSRCTYLESVSMPAATSIGMQAFSRCTCLESASMPSAESIGNGAFYECTFLESVSIPCAISIGERAFCWCSSLESVCLPRTLASLGDQAFYGLTFLDEGGRTLAQDAGSLRGYAYEGSGDKALKRLPFVQDGVSYQVCGEGLAVAVGWYGEPSGLRIPDEVQYNGKGYVPVAIADGAFAGCGTLGTISIGSSVASIGEGALDAPMLRSIEVSSGNVEYSSIAGVLYDKEAATLLKFPASKQRLVIPDTVTAIAASAFESAGTALKAEQGSGDVSYFRYVSVPGSVVSIGEGAFRGSTLEVLKLADGTTKIGAEAFSGCSALSYVVFCDTLAEVGDGAFDGCVFRDGETEMALDDALAGHKFTGEDAAHLGLYVPKPGGTIVSGDVKYRIIGSGESKALSAVRSAGEDAAELSIPATVRYLGFDWEVTSVASKAFSGLQSLRSVSFGGPVSVGPYAFFGCRSLGSVTFGGEAALGTSAFSGCSSLADADLSRVVTVGKHAFYNCALTRADLSSAETIGYGAFTGNDLREAAFSPGLESVDPKAFFRYSFCGADGAKLPVSASGLAGKTFEGSGKVLVQTS
ncbi:MAG: leucine-rich repeat domain-containing protein [Thermoplasmata archaeon]|nr:leucine-rich repeat domain-containing protein [Thermoplasmata archaeon]